MAHQLDLSSLNLKVSLYQTAPPLTWKLLPALRGFLGYTLAEAPANIRPALLEIFHERSDTPAPFRLSPEPVTSKRNVNFRMVLFGEKAALIAFWFRKVFEGQEGELMVEGKAYPIAIESVVDEGSQTVYFPTDEDPQEHESALIGLLKYDAICVRSQTPLFMKREATDLFSSGDWMQILAIRFADLSGIPRKQAMALTPNWPIKSTVESKIHSLSMGGKSVRATGYNFELIIPTSDPYLLRWILLLAQLGLGKHTAHGAGSFELLVPR